MNRDDRFYAFIVARTSRSRAHIRRVCVHKRWLKASALGLFAIVEQPQTAGAAQSVAAVWQGMPFVTVTVVELPMMPRSSYALTTTSITPFGTCCDVVSGYVDCAWPS